MKCLFVGPLGSHAAIGRVAAFAEVCDMILLDGGPHYWAGNTYPVNILTVSARLDNQIYRKPQRLKHRILELARLCGVIAEDATMVSQLKSAINQFKPDFIALHYGTIAMHYLRVIKRSGIRLPVVLIPNLLPDHVRPSGIRFRSLLRVLSGFAEHLSYRRWLKCADSIIFASNEMEEYASEKYGPLTRHTCILPDFLPKAWQTRGDLRQECDGSVRNEPSVIFIGAPERYGPVIDSIDDQFKELAKAQIHVYSGAMSDAVCKTGFGHIYSRYSDKEVFAGRLAEFAAKFDAVLITYNVKRREERFRSTYPTRFFTALGIGIPIAIRGGTFDACEGFVERYGIGFSYDNPEQLLKQLKDSAKMSAYRLRANEVRGLFSAEAQGGELRAFLGSLKSVVLP